MGTPEILTLSAGAAAVAAGVAFILLRRGRSRGPGGDPRGPGDPWLALRSTDDPARETLFGRLQRAWGSPTPVDARVASLEEILITADVGVSLTRNLLEAVKVRARELRDAESLRRALRDEIRATLADVSEPVVDHPPLVIVVAGVNGVGKTTSIGKLANRYIKSGRKVLLVAADTFRAAAGEQLQLWATRVGADCVRHQSGTDPSAVAFDGIKAGIARGADVVIVDTAGRLHVKANLIEELKKIVRVIGRQLPGAPHQMLLVIDATTGQNALNQARVFQEALSLTGIILTKIDGTAKGGAILAISSETGVPIRYVGYGEGVDEFAPFDPEAFVDALLAPSRDEAIDHRP